VLTPGKAVGELPQEPGRDGRQGCGRRRSPLAAGRNGNTRWERRDASRSASSRERYCQDEPHQSTRPGGPEEAGKATKACTFRPPSLPPAP